MTCKVQLNKLQAVDPMKAFPWSEHSRTAYRVYVSAVGGYLLEVRSGSDFVAWTGYRTLRRHLRSTTNDG